MKNPPAPHVNFCVYRRVCVFALVRVCVCVCEFATRPHACCKRRPPDDLFFVRGCTSIYRCCTSIYRCCTSINRCCTSMYRCCTSIYRCFTTIDRSCKSIWTLGFEISFVFLQHRKSPGDVFPTNAGVLQIRHPALLIHLFMDVKHP